MDEKTNEKMIGKKLQTFQHLQGPKNESREVRWKAHLFQILFQFDICVFCLFKWMQDNDVLILVWVISVLFFNVLQGHGALMRINLVILLLHFLCNLSMVRDFIFQRWSFVVHCLWIMKGVLCLSWCGFDFKIKNEQCNEDDILNNEELNHSSLRFLGWWSVLLWY
jgi:hypothetical protein